MKATSADNPNDWFDGKLRNRSAFNASVGRGLEMYAISKDFPLGAWPSELSETARLNKRLGAFSHLPLSRYNNYNKVANWGRGVKHLQQAAFLSKRGLWNSTTLMLSI